MQKQRWIKPKIRYPKTIPSDGDEPYRHWKVIQISYVWCRKSDALKFVQEGTINPDVEFVTEDRPRGWLGGLKKQLLG